MSEPLDFGEFTPRKTIDGGSKPWPLSYSWQLSEARAHLRRLASKSSVNMANGVQILVHWNRLAPTRLILREIDGLDYVTEIDPTTGAIVERSWEDLRTHIADLHNAYGIKPHERPPGAKRPD
jgi:hypothetical protein